MSIEQRVSKVAALASALADRYLSARQKLAILSSFLAPEITKILDNSYGARAHDALALTLILDLVRDICAFALDRDRRTVSLAVMWHLIQADELRAALRVKAATPSRKSVQWGGDATKEHRDALMAKWDAEEKAKREADFDAAFNRVENSLPPVLDSQTAKTLWEVRSKIIAHYEMRSGEKGLVLYPLEKSGLKWGTPREFMDQLDPIIWDVILLATWGSYDVEGFDQMHRLYAADFWARLQGKPPVNHID